MMNGFMRRSYLDVPDAVVVFWYITCVAVVVFWYIIYVAIFILEEILEEFEEFAHLPGSAEFARTGRTFQSILESYGLFVLSTARINIINS